MNKKLIKLYLRLALGIGFISPVLDRFGLWGDTWGSWQGFADYTQSILPWISVGWAKIAAMVSTGAEIIFGLALLIGWKIRLFANLSGVLLLLFALAMWFSGDLKDPLNASVFAASAAAFALAAIRVRFLEI